MDSNTKAYQWAPARCKERYSVEEALKFKPDDGIYYEEKFDGLRYLLQIRPNGAKHNFLTSRRVSSITGNFVEKQDKQPTMRDFPFPKSWGQTIFDGEICGEGISSDTQHDMVYGQVIYRVWDLLMYKGVDLRINPQEFRRRQLIAMMREWEAEYDSRWLFVVKSFSNPKALIKTVLKNGGEGIVGKYMYAGYGFGWFKVKKEITHDVIITGYTMSKSDKYGSKGWIKSIRIGLLHNGKMVDVGQVSGMDERRREFFTANQEGLIGFVIEIKAQQQLKSGKFRHGFFVRMRYDKNPSECILQ